MSVKKHQLVQRLQIIGLAALISIAVESPGSQSSQNRPAESASAEFSTQYFLQTETGSAITRYLECTDFDCHRYLNELILLGKGSVPAILFLLEEGKTDVTGGMGLVQRQMRLISALGKLKDTLAITSLLVFLEAGNPLIRAQTVTALAGIGGTETLRNILPMLNDPDPLVREVSVAALHVTDNPAALQSLQEALAKENQPHIQLAIDKAIKSLTK